MTKDEILAAAKEAGLITRGNGYYAVCHKTEIERFAAIIEKRTIERCATTCESITFTLNDGIDGDWEWGQEAGAKRCAAAIRALGEQ